MVNAGSVNGVGKMLNSPRPRRNSPRPPLNAGVVGTGEAYVLLAEQSLLIETRLEIGDETDRQIGITGLKHSPRFCRELRYLDTDARCSGTQALP